VDVTGDAQVSWDGAGGTSAVGTDYWYTEQELAAFNDGVEEGEPVFFILVLNCVSPAGDPSISLLPSAQTTFDDVPFKPKDYVIAEGGALGGGGGPGEFGVLFTIATDQVFEVTEPGRLRIRKFDRTGIAGSFSFGATEILTDTPAEIDMSGSFDFACVGPSICRP
jgi:hypothetical protein